MHSDLAPPRRAPSFSFRFRRLLLIATVGFSSQAAFADGGGVKNALLFNAGDLINGLVTVEYERALAPVFGLALGVSVATFRGAFVPSGALTPIWVGPELSARFHVIKDAPGGLWFGPSVNLVYLANTASGRAYGYGFGAAAGYNFILFDHLLIQLGAGGGLNDYGNGLLWDARLRIGVGIAF